MTTVVFRNGVMAADRRAYSGDKVPVGSKTKIKRLKDGSLLGISSTVVGASATLEAWVEAGCPQPSNSDMQPEHFELLLVRPNGEVFYTSGNLSLSGPLEADFFAIGTGSCYALGAMEMGAGPEHAVEIASRLDVWSGNGIDCLCLIGPTDDHKAD